MCHQIGVRKITVLSSKCMRRDKFVGSGEGLHTLPLLPTFPSHSSIKQFPLQYILYFFMNYLMT